MIIRKPYSHAARATAYNRVFPLYPPLHVHGRWVYGIWEIGADYKGSGYYGSYPPSYVKRVSAMFPDMNPAKTLHLFSGSLKIPGIRVDVQSLPSVSLIATATCLPFKDASFSFVMADPPYSVDDAKKYGPALPDKRKVLQELARVVIPGGHLAWLDIPKPQYRKSEWNPWGTIGILRSTNHRGRFLFLFERCA